MMERPVVKKRRIEGYCATSEQSMQPEMKTDDYTIDADAFESMVDDIGNKTYTLPLTENT